MIFYRSDYAIDKVLKKMPAQEQIFLKKHLSPDLPVREAKYLWERIADHKWLISERLKRDVGFRVAAVDYIENFYEPFFYGTRKTGLKNSLLEFLKIIAQTAFLRPKSL